MRVCIVTIAGHGLGGMQDHTRDLARGLVAAGQEVDVITTRHPEGLRVERRDGAGWHFVDAPGRCARVPFHHRDWLTGSLALFRHLHARRPFDVVHSESSSALELVRQGVHRQVPLVVQYHGTFVALARASWRRARHGRDRDWLREAKGFVWLCGMHFQRFECVRFRSCEWIVPSRQQFEDTLRGELLHRSRGHIVPNGVDARIFRPRSRAELRAELGLSDAPTLVAVGRLNAEKGFDVALRAVSSVRDAVPDLRFVVVGDGEEREALVALVAKLRLEDNVSFVGLQPTANVARYMAVSDVFLFPTRREEAAPLVLPQAMACGVPVIASSIGGITEVIGTSGRNGILIAPGDEDGLVKQIRMLLGDGGLRARIGSAARARILEEYTLDRMVERTISVYGAACTRFALERDGRLGSFRGLCGHEPEVPDTQHPLLESSADERSVA